MVSKTNKTLFSDTKQFCQIKFFFFFWFKKDKNLKSYKKGGIKLIGSVLPINQIGVSLVGNSVSVLAPPSISGIFPPAVPAVASVVVVHPVIMLTPDVPVRPRPTAAVLVILLVLMGVLSVHTMGRKVLPASPRAALPVLLPRCLVSRLY